MGCSSSLSQGQMFEKRPVGFQNGDALCLHSNNNNRKSSLSSNMDSDSSQEDLRFSSANFFIFTPDANDMSHDSTNPTDSSNIVPFIHNDRVKFEGESRDVALRKSTLSHKEEVSHHMKSALKHGRSNSSEHILANRPLKTVTFLDSVTVVTVY